MKYKKTILILSAIIIVLGTARAILFFTKKTTAKNISYKDIIVLYDFEKNKQIKSPLIVKGKARGTWFFEADFPILLVDWDGRIIAESYATAKSDWMTEDYIEFEGILEFEKPELYNRGALILQKDNPSGLPKNDDALEIPINY